MKHHSLEEWADFARGRASVDAAAEMQGHLDEGCAECARALGIWKSVLQVASREPAFRVPESAVRCAKALYSVSRPEKAASLPLRLARLVFSSFAEALREGVRGSEAATSHFLFEEGNWLLDLHVKAQAERNLVSLAGQILDRVQSERLYEGSIVAVLRGKEEVAQGTTNQFGEFQLEFPAAEDLMLTVTLAGESVLVSALPGLSRGGAANR